MDELWVCLDCDHVGHLATNGSCEVCSSQAVVTLHSHADKFKKIVLKNVTFTCTAKRDDTGKLWFEHCIRTGEEGKDK